MRITAKALFGPLMFWTVLTTVFAWLPLVRIIGRPEGYQWGILGLSGSGTDGPYWVFALLTLYVLILLFSAFRGPRALFYPMLILWHLAVTAVVVMGTVHGGAGVTWEGQGLHWSIPLWLAVIPCAAFLLVAVAWAILDHGDSGAREAVPWHRTNSVRLISSLLLLTIGLVLFRVGNNYNWVTAMAIVVTVLHWIVLVESFKPSHPTHPPLREHPRSATP